jgi:hypothetical protein
MEVFAMIFHRLTVIFVRVLLHMKVFIANSLASHALNLDVLV